MLRVKGLGGVLGFRDESSRGLRLAGARGEARCEFRGLRVRYPVAPSRALKQRQACT